MKDGDKKLSKFSKYKNYFDEIIVAKLYEPKNSSSLAVTRILFGEH